MKPPQDRPTPKENPSNNQIKLATMSLPESLAFVITAIRSDIESLKEQQNASMAALYRHLEHWRDDVRQANATDIEEAMRRHVAEYHANGGHQ